MNKTSLHILILTISLSLSIPCQAVDEKKIYTEQNTITTEEITYSKKNNEPITGILRQHGNSGELLYQAIYKNGLKNGLCQRYYPSGKLNSEVIFKDNQKDSIEFIYDESEVLQSRQNYKEGHLVDVSTEQPVSFKTLKTKSGKIYHNVILDRIEHYLEEVGNDYNLIVIERYEAVVFHSSGIANIPVHELSDSVRLQWEIPQEQIAPPVSSPLPFQSFFDQEKPQATSYRYFVPKLYSLKEICRDYNPKTDLQRDEYSNTLKGNFLKGEGIITDIREGFTVPYVVEIRTVEGTYVDAIFEEDETTKRTLLQLRKGQKIYFGGEISEFRKTFAGILTEDLKDSGNPDMSDFKVGLINCKLSTQDNISLN